VGREPARPSLPVPYTFRLSLPNFFLTRASADNAEHDFLSEGEIYGEYSTLPVGPTVDGGGASVLELPEAAHKRGVT
jgi:hypothetical protein